MPFHPLSSLFSTFNFFCSFPSTFVTSLPFLPEMRPKKIKKGLSAVLCESPVKKREIDQRHICIICLTPRFLAFFHCFPIFLLAPRKFFDPSDFEGEERPMFPRKRRFRRKFAKKKRGGAQKTTKLVKETAISDKKKVEIAVTEMLLKNKSPGPKSLIIFSFAILLLFFY